MAASSTTADQADEEKPLHFPTAHRARLEPYLPPRDPQRHRHRPASDADDGLPFTTLTFAASLDTSLSLAPGTRTLLSGPASKAMTHYLRARHDAILVGVGTAVADDPGLRCRLARAEAADDGESTTKVEGGGAGGGAAADDPLAGQPVPVVVDPTARWAFTEDAKMLRLARAGKGRPPWIVTARGAPPPPADRRELLERHGGRYVEVEVGDDNSSPSSRRRIEWHALLRALRRLGLRSVMVEGGAGVANALLAPCGLPLLDAVVVTLAPTWLGQGGVVVSPPRRRDASTGAPVPAARLTNVTWLTLGEDAVLCGEIKREQDA